MAACVDVPSFGWLQCTLTVPTSVLRHDVKGHPECVPLCFVLFFNFNFLLETESHYILKLTLKGNPPTSAL